MKYLNFRNNTFYYKIMFQSMHASSSATKNVRKTVNFRQQITHKFLEYLWEVMNIQKRRLNIYQWKTTFKFNVLGAGSKFTSNLTNFLSLLNQNYKIDMFRKRLSVHYRKSSKPCHVYWLILRRCNLSILIMFCEVVDILSKNSPQRTLFSIPKLLQTNF